MYNAVVKPQTFVGPAIEPGASGDLPYTVIEVPGRLPHAFTATAVIFPDTKVGAMFTTILLVPVPPDMVIPEGNVHV